MEAEFRDTNFLTASERANGMGHKAIPWLPLPSIATPGRGSCQPVAQEPAALAAQIGLQALGLAEDFLNRPNKCRARPRVVPNRDASWRMRAGDTAAPVHVRGKESHGSGHRVQEAPPSSSSHGLWPNGLEENVLNKCRGNLLRRLKRSFLRKITPKIITGLDYAFGRGGGRGGGGLGAGEGGAPPTVCQAFPGGGAHWSHHLMRRRWGGAGGGGGSNVTDPPKLPK